MTSAQPSPPGRPPALRAELPATAPVQGARLLGLLFAGAVLIYTCGFLAWYSTTPLGLIASTDDREILALARQIASLNLPREAFYRAPGYSALLALALHAGLPDQHLMLFARIFNGLCHLASTAMVFGLARTLWPRIGAAYLAATLVGFNPVLLHFAGDALDITLASALLVAGVSASVSPRASRGASALAATAFAAATVCRPQLLPLVGLPMLLAWHAGRRRAGDLVAGLAPVVVLLGGLATVNYLLAEDFRVLPWQGAFSAWAANHAGANGRYFAQTLTIDAYAEDANTARIESELLYRQQQPAKPDDYRTMTRYWRGQSRAAILEAPGRWLQLLASKLRYLLNNEEQYNNKTYAFHKARSPWLRHNPLGWAWVWVMAGPARLAAPRGARGPRSGRAMSSGHFRILCQRPFSRPASALVGGLGWWRHAVASGRRGLAGARRRWYRARTQCLAGRPRPRANAGPRPFDAGQQFRRSGLVCAGPSARAQRDNPSAGASGSDQPALRG